MGVDVGVGVGLYGKQVSRQAITEKKTSVCLPECMKCAFVFLNISKNCLLSKAAILWVIFSSKYSSNRTQCLMSVLVLNAGKYCILSCYLFIL